MTVFHHNEVVRPEWIDYNGHMQDAFYGLIFSYAVDAFQDAVGFDAAYRARTGCTIYLLEDHKHFLREVKEGAAVTVETRLIGFDSKRFHLIQAMFEGGETVCVGEVVELHVQQAPSPHAVPIPEAIAKVLSRHLVASDDIPPSLPRSGPIGLRR